jgi:hypothetical protein
VADRPQGRPLTGWCPRWTRMRGIPASPPRPAATGTGRTWRPSPRRGSSPTKRSPRPPVELRSGRGGEVPGRR